MICTTSTEWSSTQEAPPIVATTTLFARTWGRTSGTTATTLASGSAPMREKSSTRKHTFYSTKNVFAPLRPNQNHQKWSLISNSRPRQRRRRQQSLLPNFKFVAAIIRQRRPPQAAVRYLLTSHRVRLMVHLKMSKLLKSYRSGQTIRRMTSSLRRRQQRL